TAAERRDLPNAVARVAQLLGNILSEGGMRKWGVKVHVDTQVCDKEIAWAVTKVPLKTIPEEEVVKRVRDQLEAVYVGRIKGVWITNRKSCPVFIRGLERTPALMGEDVIDETIRCRWPTVQWGERHAHFTQMGVGNKGVKAEVSSAEEAKKWFERGLKWEGRRYAVIMWESTQKAGPTNAWNKPLNTTGSIPIGPKNLQQTQTQQRGSAPG